MSERVVLSGRFRLVREGGETRIELEPDEDVALSDKIVLIHPSRKTGTEPGDIYWVCEAS